jgi:hypothetical protein
MRLRDFMRRRAERRQPVGLAVPDQVTCLICFRTLPAGVLGRVPEHGETDRNGVVYVCEGSQWPPVATGEADSSVTDTDPPA